MKYTIAAAVLALAEFAAAGAVAKDYKPYPCWLSQEDAEDIVGGYSSIMMNKTWHGMETHDTLKKYLAPTYTEVSDSVLSLMSKTNTLGVDAAPVTTDRDVWYAGVTAHPLTSVITKDILVAGGSNVLWYWTFNGVGIGRYPTSGFNLLRINEDMQIAEADIEFNSIAWGVDIFEIQQYCS